MKQRFNDTVGEIWARIAARGVMHWTSFLALLVLFTLAAGMADDASFSQQLRENAMQGLSELRPFQTAVRTSILVLIDDAAFYGLNHGEHPIEPEMLADIVRTLSTSGVIGIVLDLDFTNPDPTNPDVLSPKYRTGLAKFRSALCEASQHAFLVLPVVLSADGEQVAPSLLDNISCGVGSISVGLVNLSEDTAYVQRGIVEHGHAIPSMPVAIRDAVLRDAHGEAPELQPINPRFDARPPLWAPVLPVSALPRALASRLLSRDADTLRMVHHQVALIGGAWHERSRESGVVVDTYETTRGPRLGAFLQANHAEALMARDVYPVVSPWWLMVTKFAWLLALGVVMGIAERQSTKVLWVVAGVATNLVLSALVFVNFGLAADFALPLIMMVVHPAADQLIEWRTHAKLWENQYGTS